MWGHTSIFTRQSNGVSSLYDTLFPKLRLGNNVILTFDSLNLKWVFYISLDNNRLT